MKISSKIVFLFIENGYCLKDSKKFPGQTLTPRHTIDAILGLNDRCDNLGGELISIGCSEARGEASER